MSGLHRGKDTVMQAVGIAAAILFVFMTLIGTYQILTRYVLGKPSTVSEELLTYAFAWMALLASAYVFGKNDHMRMAFLADKVTGTPKKMMEVAIQFLIFAFAAVVMVYGGMAITKLSMTQITASLRIPMGYVYMMVPISGILIMFFSLVNALDVFNTDYNKEVH